MAVKKRAKRSGPTDKDYIDNKKFYQALVAYRAQPEPRTISNYIGECFYLINERLGRAPNFRNYSYLDEMKGDGIENCIVAINSFDPNKTNNPFTYFTTISFFAFVRRIQAEKKQQYIKHKNVKNLFVDGELEIDNNNELSDTVISDFETKLKEKKLKNK